MKKLSFITLFLLTSCLVRQVEYSPQLIADKDPHAIIQQVILEQPKKTAPTDFAINENYFQVTTTYWQRKRRRIISKEERPAVITVYFNNIGNIELKHHGNYYTVYIFDRAATLKYKVFTMQETHARSLVDALHTLASTNTPTAR